MQQKCITSERQTSKGVIVLAQIIPNNIVVEDDIKERFRRTVANTKGFRKGNISIALQEAIELWIKEQTRRKSSKDGE